MTRCAFVAALLASLGCGGSSSLAPGAPTATRDSQTETPAASATPATNQKPPQDPHTKREQRAQAVLDFLERGVVSDALPLRATD